MTTAASRVLVIGGGLTSAVTTAMLAEKLAQGSVHVLDKARGAGGRMSTSRSPGNPQCKVDLGAQYVSAAPIHQCKHQDVYAELLASGVLLPLDTQDIPGFRKGEEGTKHYYTPDGMSSLVKHFFKRSGVDVEFGQRITDISKSACGKMWTIKTEKGLQVDYEAVVVTMPVPQVLELKGDINTIIRQDSQLHDNLKGVDYSARFALGLFFDVPVDLGVDWTTSYISNHPIFRYVAIDNLKRGDVNGPTSVIAHTSVPFGIKNIEVTPDAMKDKLVAALAELYPDWPEPANVKCLKWRYSQVSKSYPGSPGNVVLNQDPPLLLAGDGFAATSNFDGCVASAISAANFIINTLE